MTSSIDAQTRAQTPTPPGSKSDTLSRSQIVTGVRWYTGLTATISIGLLLHAFAGVDWRSALASATFFILAVLGGAILTVEALLVERRKLYQHAHLDGWMNCLHGRPPEVDDPLLR